MGHRILMAGSLALTILTVGCDHDGWVSVRGSGIAGVLVKSFDPFREIDVSGALKVTYRAGDRNEVTITGDENIVGLVETRLSNGALRIRMRPNVRIEPALPIEIEVVGQSIESVDVSGASSITLRGIDEPSLEIDASGASRVQAIGRATEVHIDASGASRVDGSELHAVEVDLDASGASNITIWADESISGDASGASNVRWSGSADDVDVETSGASQVHFEGAQPTEKSL